MRQEEVGFVLDLRGWQVCVSWNRSKKTARPVRRHETTTEAQNLLAVQVRIVAGCCSCSCERCAYNSLCVFLCTCFSVYERVSSFPCLALT